MRKIMFAAVAALTLAMSSGAFAQSHQGGYLGVNPGANQTATATPAPQHGSGQGGYLGGNVGANQPAAKRAAPSLAEKLADPVAWCATSIDPDHCRGNAAEDQKICVADPQHYDACRFAMLQMFHN